MEEALLAADVVIFKEEKILLIKRKAQPFKGMWALPGGFVEKGETFEQAAYRELEEETNIKNVMLKRIGVFDEPDRDPREKRVITHGFIGILEGREHIEPGDDAEETKFFNIENLPDIAFDHNKIIEKAKKIK